MTTALTGSPMPDTPLSPTSKPSPSRTAVPPAPLAQHSSVWRDCGMVFSRGMRLSLRNPVWLVMGLARERQTVCVSDRGDFHGVGIRPSK